MYTFLLIGCLLLGGIGWLLRKKSTLTGQICIGASVAGCLALTVWQAMQSLGSAGVQRSHRGQASVGYTLAQQFLSDSKQRNGEIVLIFPPDKETPPAALDSFYEGYARVMARFRTLQLKEVTMDISSKAIDRGDVDAKALGDVISEHPNALAFVSWVGFPKSVDGIKLFERESFPPIYLYNPSTEQHWKSSMEAGIIQAVATAKVPTTSTPALPNPMNPQEFFKQNYELILRPK